MTLLSYVLLVFLAGAWVYRWRLLAALILLLCAVLVYVS